MTKDTKCDQKKLALQHKTIQGKNKGGKSVVVAKSASLQKV